MAPPAPDLREACVAAAHAVIADVGIEKLSLRDVARRLGVSHQAPYKHFPSRDHLLAEVMRRCFEQFADHLSASLSGTDPLHDMDALGQAYLGYALSHPLEYRLMFGTPWPDTAQHPDLLRDARHAFRVLQQAIASMRGNPGKPTASDNLDALYVWSSMHGLATILQSNVMEKLPLGRGVRQQSVPHAMALVRAALQSGPMPPMGRAKQRQPAEAPAPRRRKPSPG